MNETIQTSPQLTKADVSRRNVWTRPGVLASVLVAVVLYGSLLPFDFVWSAAVRDSGSVIAALWAALMSPQWVTAKQGVSPLGVPFVVSDLLMNLVLYLPLGVTLRMALRNRWHHWPIEMLGTCGIALALSWTVESLQSLMPMRVASLNDVLANTVAALVAAMLAPVLWQAYRRSSFWLYCRLAGVIARLRRLATRPGVAIAIAILNALLIGLWYVGELHEAGIGDQTVLALPFERAFALPYDLGVMVLGEALLAYAGIGCLLLLMTYTGIQRVAMGWVVLAVVVLAFGAELSRAATHNAVPDITGPLLALSAAAIMGVTIYTFSFAVKRSNRRYQAHSFDGPDRRRIPHDYA
ncbi:MAG: VanZ family protein [Planctomycetota bacterium]